MAEIRSAQAADLGFIDDCTRAAYAKYIERLGRTPEPMTRDYRAPITDGQVWILEDGGEARGLLVLSPEPEALLIFSIAVDPAAQGHGYGKRLMRFAQDEARRRELHRVRLYTNERMTENIAFYRTLGYRETHREPFKGSQTVHMTLDLSPQ